MNNTGKKKKTLFACHNKTLVYVGSKEGYGYQKYE